MIALVSCSLAAWEIFASATKRPTVTDLSHRSPYGIAVWAWLVWLAVHFLGEGRKGATRNMAAKHPGFQKAAASIARKEGIPAANARAIIASSARHASPAAKKANPRLNRVRG